MLPHNEVLEKKRDKIYWKSLPYTWKAHLRTAFPIYALSLLQKTRAIHSLQKNLKFSNFRQSQIKQNKFLDLLKYLSLFPLRSGLFVDSSKELAYTVNTIRSVVCQRGRNLKRLRICFLRNTRFQDLYLQKFSRRLYSSALHMKSKPFETMLNGNLPMNRLPILKKSQPSDCSKGSSMLGMSVQIRRATGSLLAQPICIHRNFFLAWITLFLFMLA